MYAKMQRASTGANRFHNQQDQANPNNLTINCIVIITTQANIIKNTTIVHQQMQFFSSPLEQIVFQQMNKYENKIGTIFWLTIYTTP
jgi:hypothetical protein